jgi:hypothetical protein
MCNSPEMLQQLGIFSFPHVNLSILNFLRFDAAAALLREAGVLGFSC